MRHEKIEYKSIEDLIPYARNQRIHSDEQVKKIAASIKEFGFKNPVIVDKEGTIIAGHGRCLAAEKLKIKELPVIVADDLNASQVKALRLADNRLQDLSAFDDELVNLELEELSELDFDLELTGFTSGISLDDIEEVELPKLRDCDKEPFQTMTFKLHDDQVDSINKAVNIAKSQGYSESELNTNSNGNAIYYICEFFINGQS